MANLSLPHLRELFLHRNQILAITGLSGCPRIKRLWLFQNQITSLHGLYAVPELEELWIQANEITRLDGLEYNVQLKRLGLAGNPIQQLGEMSKLSSSLRLLHDISFHDIHFGRCEMVDEEGYLDYLLLALPMVSIVDGVKVKKEMIVSAEEKYYTEVSRDVQERGCSFTCS